MDCIGPSFKMFGEMDCVLLLVPSEAILHDETNTGLLLTPDTGTGRYNVIPDNKLSIYDALSVSVPYSWEFGRSSWG